jgi:hypothetical protein
MNFQNFQPEPCLEPNGGSLAVSKKTKVLYSKGPAHSSTLPALVFPLPKPWF